MLRAAFVIPFAAALAFSPCRAQEPAARVLAVLRAHDPLRDGTGAAELLAPDRACDQALRDLAAAPTAGEPLVQRRALRLCRLLDLADLLAAPSQPRDAAWWLACDEIARETPAGLRTALLARAFANPEALAAATRELDAANRLAERFCSEWNETRTTAPDDTEREQYRVYDELEAGLARAGQAAVPGLLRHLVPPPEATFAAREPAITARHQVRALLALAAILKCKAALPYYVLHAQGPSLTQSADAALAVQQLGAVALGAAPLQAGDDARLLAHWREHRAEHGAVLDHLVHHVVAAAVAACDQAGAAQRTFATGAVARLYRVLDGDGKLVAGDDAAAWRAQLEAIADAWSLAHRRERR